MYLLPSPCCCIFCLSDFLIQQMVPSRIQHDLNVTLKYDFEFLNVTRPSNASLSQWASFVCCISSSETTRGAAERHEGWCHTSPCDHRQDTPRRCAPANVREEHTEPVSQPGTRGRLSEPVTDLTADASATLTNDLARFTLTDWGQSLSPHRHVADVPSPQQLCTVQLVFVLHLQHVSGLRMLLPVMKRLELVRMGVVWIFCVTG